MIRLYGLRRIVSVSPVTLAPKKKAGKGSDSAPVDKVATDADHVFNIFAATEDTKLQPDDYYPNWLWDLNKPQKTYGEMEAMFVYGQNIEDATLGDYRRFLRHHRKILIKMNNKMLSKRPRVCESKLLN